MIKVIKLNSLCDDTDLETMKGEYFGSEWIIDYIDEDTDIYDEDDNFILSYRKKVLKECDTGWDNYHKLVGPSRIRGASAGPIDPTHSYWTKRLLHNTKGFTTGYLKDDGTPSKMKVNNNVYSNAFGYFDKIKNRGLDLPCRLTAFTLKNIEKFNAGLPFLQELSDWYSKLNSIAYKNQIDRINKTPLYKIGDTPFSTITINRNFRTALHKDTGDYGGVAVMSVLEQGEYNGGCFMIPKFGIGVNMREGDVLVADVHQFHCNSEYWTTKEQDKANKKLDRVYGSKNDILGSEYDFNRVSFVCYLREKMINC